MDVPPQRFFAYRNYIRRPAKSNPHHWLGVAINLETFFHNELGSRSIGSGKTNEMGEIHDT
jgi:hypothetical protein